MELAAIFWQVYFQSVVLADLWVRRRRFQCAMDFLFCGDVEMLGTLGVQTERSARKLSSKVRTPHLKSKDHTKVASTIASRSKKPEKCRHCQVPGVKQVGQLQHAGLHVQDEELGRGAFGSVRRGIFRGNQVAVKLIPCDDCDASVPKR